MSSTTDEAAPVRMSLQLADEAPDFTAITTDGPIWFHDWLGESWGLLFSHAHDFAPVCTTELGTVARMKPEFDRRDVKVIGLSVDPINAHRTWADDIAETQGRALNFPLIADPERVVSDLYGMIHPNAGDPGTVRSLFVIGPDKLVKLTLAYPVSTGRNFWEILRAIDSLQLTTTHKVATPANWQAGEDVIIVPTVADEEAHRRFRAGWKAPKPYLRTTPQP
jgi:thioredoxin-dependent peroxiredoxin